MYHQDFPHSVVASSEILSFYFNDSTSPSLLIPWMREDEAKRIANLLESGNLFSQVIASDNFQLFKDILRFADFLSIDDSYFISIFNLVDNRQTSDYAIYLVYNYPEVTKKKLLSIIYKHYNSCRYLSGEEILDMIDHRKWVDPEVVYIQGEKLDIEQAVSIDDFNHLISGDILIPYRIRNPTPFHQLQVNADIPLTPSKFYCWGRIVNVASNITESINGYVFYTYRMYCNGVYKGRYTITDQTSLISKSGETFMITPQMYVAITKSSHYQF